MKNIYRIRDNSFVVFPSKIPLIVITGLRTLSLYTEYDQHEVMEYYYLKQFRILFKRQNGYVCV